MSMVYIYEVFEHLLTLWMGIWLHNHTVTSIDASPDWGKFAEILPDASMEPCHYALVEAVEPFKLHPMSMAYIYEVFEYLLSLWMGIWLHTHTVTTTDASSDWGKLAEIIPDACVQSMPLCHD
jgi:hypothetical protein